MIVHQVYAQISEGEIKNIIVCDNYEMANYLARATYGDAAIAVDCLQYPCNIGDSYVDGEFRRTTETGETVVIEPLPTQEQEVTSLKAENETLSTSLTDTQLALVEVYEMLG